MCNRASKGTAVERRQFTESPSPTRQVNLALLEAGAKFNRYEVDLINKPDWFVKQINPVGKVPALTYGGPNVPLDQPSPESVKLNESRVLLEFIVDLFPKARLLPEDPVLRAKARFFSEVVLSRLFPAWHGYWAKGQPTEPIVAALEEMQALLPPSGFAVGEWSIADAAAASILARTEVIFEINHPINGWAESENRKMLDLLDGPLFVRLKQYRLDLAARPAFKASFDKTVVKDFRALFDFLVQPKQ
ncbi:hypothetical protein CERSUDRAFT_123300 [Gelatoporia subvermispora B]|uniref:GST N-terminal domain-containing protein n=1 Tax=Ceriporiopsis subvermispora (strain B) TaxID=914234 RepID=M2RFR2_CERS8|nr:hypothetical protein CERSUDRAFT_123300 [Gelatoporia subvermispora B]